MTGTDDALGFAENGARDKVDSEMTHAAVGTGNQSFSAGDDQLTSEVFRDTFDSQSKSAGQLNKQIIIGATEANGNDLSEAGAFNDANSGDMLQAATFTETTKTNEIEVLVDFDITFNATQT